MINETNTIVQLKAILEKAITEIEKMIVKREDYYNNRSQTWLESDKADEYLEDTENLRTHFDNLTEAETALTDTFE